MHQVLFDCERMKKPYTGLFYYDLFLGKHILKACEKDESIALVAYTTAAQDGILGRSPSCKYLHCNRLQKFWLPSTRHLDIWHCTFQMSDYFPFRKNKNLKVVLTVHDINFAHDTQKSDSKKRRYAERLRKRIHRADHIIVISEFVKQDLLKHNLLPEDKPVSVVYNSHCLPDTDLPDTFLPSFVPKKPFLFSIGTVMLKKNFHVLPSLLLGNDFHLVIAGAIVDQDYLEEIHRAVRDWGVEDRVTILPPVSDQEKIWYYKHCKAFVFLSLAEGFGIPVIEAMSFGKPTLLSRLTSLPEIGGEYAFYVDNFEPKHMQLQLNQCLLAYENDPSLKDKIITHTKQFSWEIAAQKHLEIYKSLLS